MKMSYFSSFIIWSILLPALKSEAEPHVWYCNDSKDWCYSISDLTNFHDAKAYCRLSDSNLTSIISKRENEDVANLCGCQSCWIGLVERTEGDWYWLDGSNSTYRNWHKDEPNNYDGVDEKYTCMNIVVPDLFLVSRTWFDVTDDFPAVAICKQWGTTVAAKGSVVKNLPQEKECKAKDNRNESGGAALFFLLLICCCCCGCYCCYRRNARNIEEISHAAVLRNQEEFLRSQRMPLNRPPAHFPNASTPQDFRPEPGYRGFTHEGAPPVNPPAYQAYGEMSQEGVPQQFYQRQSVNVEPAPTTQRHFEVEGDPAGKVDPPRYNRNM